MPEIGSYALLLAVALAAYSLVAGILALWLAWNGSAKAPVALELPSG